MWPFVLIAYADVDTTIHSINQHILNPLIVFMFAVAAVFFAYGLFEYIKDSDNADAREKGKNHIIWGLIGMFIMVTVFYLMRFIVGTLGIEDEINVETGEANLPAITIE